MELTAHCFVALVVWMASTWAVVLAAAAAGLVLPGLALR